MNGREETGSSGDIAYYKAGSDLGTGGQPLDFRDQTTVDAAMAPSKNPRTLAGPKSNVQQRGYQDELAREALDGKNAVIVAPTGSGKTYVAGHILRNHLLEAGNGPRKRVVFVVPTVPLVSQQKKVLQQFVGADCKLVGIQGGESERSKSALIKDNDVIVATAQCIVNSLNDTDAVTKLAFSDFTLLFFDECHHCDEKHPYMTIMNKYLDLKFSSQADSDAEPPVMPQIIGMTASLGVGKGDNMDKAKDHMTKMAAHLDAQVFSTVRDAKNLEELYSLVNVPTDEIVLAEDKPTPQGKIFLDVINNLMEKIENKLLESLEVAVDSVYVKDDPNRPKAAPPLPRSAEAYCNWVNNLLNTVPALADSVMKRELIASLQYLRLRQTSMRHAYSWLESQLEEKRMKHEGKEGVEGWLLDQWAEVRRELDPHKDKKGTSPLLSTLLKTLMVEFQGVEEGALGILFVKTRDLTKIIKSVLDENEIHRNLNAEILTTTDKGGLTEQEQQRVLKEFRAGRCRLLIATTVAEEGLDIKECQLIFCYNYVTNEIARVQKKGRGRAGNSRSILLTLNDGVIEKERVNQHREKLMKEALLELIEEGQDVIRGKAEEIQKAEYDDRVYKIKVKNEWATAERTIHPLRCIKCNGLICTSDQIRQIQGSHYVIIDPLLWGRAYVEPLGEASQHLARISITGRLSCGTTCDDGEVCREGWGKVMRYKKSFLPLIKAECFVVGKEVGSKENFPRKKKWKDIVEKYFPVQEGVLNPELAAMKRSLDPDLAKKLDVSKPQ